MSYPSNVSPVGLAFVASRLKSVSVGLALALVLCANDLPAATYTWSTGDGDWSVADNWSPSGPPGFHDIVRIETNAAASRTVTYDAAADGTFTNVRVYLGNSGAGTNTLRLDTGTFQAATLTMTSLNGTVLQNGGTVEFRRLSSQAGSPTLEMNSAGARYELQSGSLSVIANGWLQACYLTRNDVFLIKGGRLSISGNVTVGGGAGARLRMEGGSVSLGSGSIGVSSGIGTLEWLGGTWTNAYGSSFQAGGASCAQCDITASGSGTRLVVHSLTLLPGAGPVTLTQSNNAYLGLRSDNTANGIVVGGAGGSVPCTYNLLGGTADVVRFVATYGKLTVAANGIFNMGDSNGTGRLIGGSPLYVMDGGLFRGHGVIGMSGLVENNGRVVADGYGVERDLDLRSFASVTNATDNTTSNGWFAVNRGRLAFKAVAVSAGNSTNNLGESVADTTIDLVNSARIELTGATAGSITGVVVAVDRSDVPASDQLNKTLAVWQLSGPPFVAARITFRYDDARAAALKAKEGDLRVWQYVGGRWRNVMESKDGVTKTITTSAITSLGFFAVAPQVLGTMFIVK